MKEMFQTIIVLLLNATNSVAGEIKPINQQAENEFIFFLVIGLVIAGIISCAYKLAQVGRTNQSERETNEWRNKKEQG